MARVNLERRAEIGLAKRNRTRAAILEAARACYAAPKAAPVTVDAVMQAAGLAKGTFYVHFAGPWRAGGGAWRGADRGARPASAAGAPRGRPSADAPGHGCHRPAARPRSLAGTGAAGGAGGSRDPRRRQRHAGAPAPGPGGRARRRPAGGALGRSRRAHRDGAFAELAASELAERRIDDDALPDIVRAILRAIGCTPREAARHAEAAARHADAYSR